MRIDKGSFINDFIDRKLRQYSIPVYQRNYEWSAEQCEKLFDDIIQAYKQDRYHFTGSVVYSLLKTENKIDHFVIIDGQQRLTTIYILIKALCDISESEYEKDKLEDLLFNKDPFHKYSIDESSKLKLKPIKSDNIQLLLLMENRISEMDKSSKIYQNYNLFCKLTKKALSDDGSMSIERIYDGLNHLTCATIKLEDEEKGKEQEIFERINSTGVPLSISDKIRNFVLMTDVDQERLYEDYWLKVEQMLSINQMSNFFLDYLNLKIDKITKEKDAYDDFKQLYKSKDYTNESMLQEILHYANQYNTFLNGNKELSKDINEALSGLKRLNQTTVYLFLFKVFDDFENNVIDESVLAKVLKLLLNYSIRRLICEVGSNSLRGLYKTLYYRVFNREENKQYYYDAIVSFLLQLTSKDSIPDNEKFVLALKENNLYRKNALCKYLLVAIENQGKEKLLTKDLSIEHVMPQNRSLSKNWQTMLGERWEYVHEKYLHTLGNLTLTGYNPELGDKPFDVKKDMLINPEIPTHITILYNDILNQDKWDEHAIVKRADNLSKLILKLFPIEAPSTSVDFSDPRYKLYTVADPEEARYKKVNYYELLGERVNISAFSTMVHSVAVKLFELDSSKIEELAKTNGLIEGWRVPVLSYDINSVKNGSELKKGSGIYISSGYSATDCVYFIRGLLKLYELDLEEDFIYSARDNKDENDSNTSYEQRN